VYLQGKYRTILYLSVVYCIGNWVLALAATPKPGLGTKTTVFWYTAGGLALIALGTGGIKPCAVAFGGDQIQCTHFLMAPQGIISITSSSPFITLP
jgi:dipeptide/tripeptide permease